MGPEKPNSRLPGENNAVTACPHCGTELTSWEQVLLSIDRTLMCKNCWYPIILDVFEGGDEDQANKSGNN